MDPKPNGTKYSRCLINELQNPSTARLEIILDCIQKDPLSGLIQDTDTGDNSYHLLMGGGYNENFILTVLDALLGACPEGLRTQNKNLSLPLHVSLCSHLLLPRVVLKVLEAYPNGAGVKNSLGLVPLVLCVMREDASADVCKALCKAYPSGPSTINPSSHSYPLHYASKRIKPNMAILKMLIKRYPSAACHANDYGLYPLHCLCSSSDSLPCAKLLLKANPDAVKVPDKQGRTCLHLAVLVVGKDHSNAVAKEEEEIYMLERRDDQWQCAREDTNFISSNKFFPLFQDEDNEDYDVVDENDESDEEVDDETNNRSTRSNSMEIHERQGTLSRNLIRYLINKYPHALVVSNNFFFTPVQTVLEKTRPVKSPKKIVTVFGLADDPPTARLLLLAQKKLACIDPTHVPRLTSTYNTMLKELNWFARRDALLISYEGGPRPGTKYSMILKTLRNDLLKGTLKECVEKSKGKLSMKSKQLKHLNSWHEFISRVERTYAQYNDVPEINILAKLRKHGFEDIVRLIVTWL